MGGKIDRRKINPVKIAKGRKPIIKVSNVQKKYVSKKLGEVLAIENISFDVSEGEFITVVGPSGCGKTTLLKIISGLLPLTKGSVTLRDKLVTGPQADIGMVFQASVLLKWRTALKNAELPVEILGLDEEEYHKKALDLLKLVGLEGFENRYPIELSGGMQQRVAICRALIHDPSLLIMDEPFGALDALTRDEMNLELLRVWREKKKTVIFVTHYIPEAVFLADRVIILTARPSSVAKVLKIDLPRPRTWGTKTSKKYRDYVQTAHKTIGYK